MDSEERELIEFLASTQHVRSLAAGAYVKLAPLLDTIELERGDTITPSDDVPPSTLLFFYVFFV